METDVGVETMSFVFFLQGLLLKHVEKGHVHLQHESCMITIAERMVPIWIHITPKINVT